MIVRLHNLSARAPKLADVDAVGELMALCNAFDEAGSADEDGRRHELQVVWQASGFNIARDAWVIVNRREQIVGYGDSRDIAEGCFGVYTYVHPEYRGRGIATLLLRLIETRARERMLDMDADLGITMQAVASSSNNVARHLFEREGYAHVHSFWRVLVEMREVPAMEPQGSFKFDFVVDANAWTRARHLREQVGMYSAYQYHVYEKMLRCGRQFQADILEADMLTSP
ncbi:MAG TPA: GNAT family N-acetyltransferase [Ktedonobacteraceae bacterium]|jgi:GNAT superfamily N-acetyltransferase